MGHPRVGEADGIVSRICVQIPALRIVRVLIRIRIVRRHEAAEGGGVVAGAEVVEVGFGIAFFAGEFVGEKCVLAGAVIHEGQCVVGLGATGTGRFVIKKQGNPFGFGSCSSAPKAVGKKDCPRAIQLRQSLLSSADA